jgi:FAD dependent oxidoreductase TIGR03364
MDTSYDDAVVGAGIIGLAHAYHLAQRGRRVIVCERSERAEGASVRNFGLLWPIGQPIGPLRGLAERSLEHWRAVLVASGCWHDQPGSLHLAYHDDEAQVLQEFVALAREAADACELLDPREVRRRAPRVRPEGLRGGLFSPWEMCVDPREVLARVPGWLAETFGVRFTWGRAVVGFDRPLVRRSGEDVLADRLWVCSGEDFATLYPETLRASGLRCCKLQMLRTAPLDSDGPRLGPLLAAGLTLRHYQAFAACPTLPALNARITAERPELDRFGIHVLVAQNGRGELTLGDSHEYGDAIDPFDKAEIDDLILGYLATFLNVPGLRIKTRWRGIYAQHPTEPYFVARPEEGVTVVTGLGGAGMTLAFGLAEQVVRETLDEA